MIPQTGCKLFGAYRTAVSIKDGVILIHSTIGCSWGTMAFHIPSRLKDIRQASTVLYGDDVVFGGERSLDKALTHMVDLYDSSVIFVLTGCVAEIMEDDVERIIKKNQGATTIIPVKAAGFKGDMQSGYLDTMKILVDQMCGQVTKLNSVNLIGLFSDDFRVDADLDGIQQLLGEHVELHTIVPYDTFEKIVLAPAAALNVVFSGFECIGEYMQQKFGMPYVLVDYPYGLEASRRFSEKIADALGVEKDHSLQQQAERAVRTLENAFDYIHQFYGMPVGVAGDLIRANALADFLENELGMDVEAYCDSTQVERNDFEEAVRKRDIVLLFGSSFERELADQKKIPLVRYSYPIFDSISISKRGYAGYSGLVNLVEDIVNAIMTADYKREGVYGRNKDEK